MEHIVKIALISLIFSALGCDGIGPSKTNDTGSKASWPPTPGTDGTQINSTNFHWAKLPIHVRLSKEMPLQIKQAAIAAMQTWEWAIGKQLFTVTEDGDNAPQTRDQMAAMKNDYSNVVYLLPNWSILDEKSSSTLGVTFTNYTGATSTSGAIASNSDIVLNGDYFEWADAMAMGEGLVSDTQTTLTHELGHLLLGSEHIPADRDPLSVMNPTSKIGYGMAKRRLSRIDIERAHDTYGCKDKACDIDGLLKSDQRINSLGDVGAKLRDCNAEDGCQEVPFD